MPEKKQPNRITEFLYSRGWAHDMFAERWWKKGDGVFDEDNPTNMRTAVRFEFESMGLRGKSDAEKADVGIVCMFARELDFLIRGHQADNLEQRRMLDFASRIGMTVEDMVVLGGASRDEIEAFVTEGSPRLSDQQVAAIRTAMFGFLANILAWLPGRVVPS